MKTRAILAVWSIWLVAAPAARAFSKFEHEQLTYYAYEYVRARACAGGPAPSTLCEAGLPSQELAVVARAVDYFTYPMRLAPWPEDCRLGRRSHCRKKVLRSSACQPSSFHFHACADKARDVTRTKLETRRDNWLYRFLAVHRNDEHFRDAACTSFNEMHGRALDLAAAGSPDLALIAEAVAIHFLQDAMAPGHLAAPRDQFGDWQAGAVHDRHNRDGLPVAVSPAVCDGVTRLPAVADISIPESWSEVAADKLLTWDRLRRDLSALAERCRDGGFRYTSYGDRSLLPGVDVPEARVHAATVFYLSVAALEDLYGIASRAPMRMYYDPPHYDASTAQGRPPELGLRAAPRGSEGASADVCPGRPGAASELFSYALDDSPQLHFVHLLNTLQLAYSTWGEARRRWEVAWDAVARERLLTRLADGSLEKAALWRQYLGVGSWTVHHEKLRDNEVWGLGLLSTYSRQFTKYRDFDAYVGIEPGVGFYQLDGSSTARFRGSLRAGIGISVVAVEALVEHGRSLDPGRAAEDEWRWSVNLRLRLSPTWLRRGAVRKPARGVDR